MDWVDTRRNGTLVKFNAYPDFKRFESGNYISMTQRQKAWAHAQQAQVDSTLLSAMIPEALKAAGGGEAVQEAINGLVGGKERR